MIFEKYFNYMFKFLHKNIYFQFLKIGPKSPKSLFLLIGIEHIILYTYIRLDNLLINHWTYELVCVCLCIYNLFILVLVFLCHVLILVITITCI
jgi:hypothetical protein